MAKQPGAESGRRLLAILFCFSERSPVRSVSELAEQTGLPSSSVYRYVSLLRDEGVLDAAGAASYRLTDRVLGLARACQAGQVPLIEVSRSHIEQLAQEVDETVLIVRRGGNFVYCVDRVESSHPVRLQFSVGQAMPLHLGSAARVLLAHLPRAERDRYLAGLPAEERRRQAATLSDQALDAIVRDGWTESFEEVDEGIWGTAAVIVSDGKPVAAVGTAGPMYRLVEERRRQIVDLIRDRADKISADLTGRY